MDAGSLDERIIVQQPTETRNRLGESVFAWTTFATVWAKVDGVTAREALLAGQQQLSITHRVRLRYLTGLTTKMRLSWRGRTLEIVSLLEQEGRTIHELICQEAV
jgi:SPP1 family predicted phage head-tail adaptor